MLVVSRQARESWAEKGLGNLKLRSSVLPPPRGWESGAGMLGWGVSFPGCWGHFPGCLARWSLRGTVLHQLLQCVPEGQSPLEWGGGVLTAQGRPTEENPLAQLRVSAVPGALMANGTLGPGREAPQTEPIVCTVQSGTEFCLSFSVLLGTCLFI